MKTRITATLLLAAGFAFNATAQNAWTPEPTNKYYVPETPVQVLSRTETFFGADFTYSNEGAKITNVIPNSPAESFNFRNGDIITAIGSVAINSEEDYKHAMEINKPDETVSVSYIRKGTQKTRKVKLDKITVYKTSGTK